MQAGGGGDMPEALNEALHETVHRMSWRSEAARLVVLVADAPPHLDYGGCMEPAIRRRHAGRPGAGQYGSTCGGAGQAVRGGRERLDPVGEYIYRQIAQYTAGRFVFLTYKDAADPGSGPGTRRRTTCAATRCRRWTG